MDPWKRGLSVVCQSLPGNYLEGVRRSSGGGGGGGASRHPDISKHQKPHIHPSKTHPSFHLLSNMRPICPRFAEYIYIFSPSDLRSKTSTSPFNTGIHRALPVTALHITQLSDLYSTELARIRSLQHG